MSQGKRGKSCPNRHLARTGNGRGTNANVGAGGWKGRRGQTSRCKGRKTPGSPHRGDGGRRAGGPGKQREAPVGGRGGGGGGGGGRTPGGGGGKRGGGCGRGREGRGRRERGGAREAGRRAPCKSGRPGFAPRGCRACGKAYGR